MLFEFFAEKTIIRLCLTAYIRYLIYLILRVVVKDAILLRFVSLLNVGYLDIIQFIN